MEGAGARLGRQSNRYGTTTVYTGPVRKWNKNWVPITPPSSSLHNNNSNHHNNSNDSLNGSTHLRLYKWTPLSIDNSRDSPTDDAGPTMEPPRRKFKFIPIAVLGEHKKENENSNNEEKLDDANEDIKYVNNKKPDINDVPMEENQDSEYKTAPTRQDLNELDLSLGLTSDEEEHD